MPILSSKSTATDTFFVALNATKNFCPAIQGKPLAEYIISKLTFSMVWGLIWTNKSFFSPRPPLKAIMGKGKSKPAISQ